MKTVSNFLAFILRPVADIRQGERMKTAVMFFYFSLTIALIYILKPVRGALFLGELGAKNLRYVYMGEGIFLIFVVAAYVHLSKKLPRKIFFTSILLFFASNLVLFWFLFKLQTPYLSAVFYIWVASFSITSTTQFWILANDAFNPSEAKRLFGLIISGGSAGGILGGLMTSQAMRWLRAEDMMLVAAGVLVVCVFLIVSFWSKIPQRGGLDATTEKREDSKDAKKISTRKLFTGSNYLIKLALVVVIAKMISTVIDNQFNRVVEMTIIGTQERTAFFAGFMAWLNVVSLLMQLFVTSICLRFLGVGFSLWILPVGIAIFSFGSLIYPALLAGLLLKVFDGSVNYSVQQASKEVLFLPLSSQLRYRVKPVIDMLGFRAAKSFAGVYIAIFAPLLGLHDERLGVLILVLIPFWLLLIWRMRSGYSALLRRQLLSKKGTGRADALPKAAEIVKLLRDQETILNVQQFLDHPSPYARKIAATALISYIRSNKNAQPARQLIEKLTREDGVGSKNKIETLSQLGAEALVFLKKLVEPEGLSGEKEALQKNIEECPEGLVMKLGTILREKGNPIEMRHQAARILGLIPQQQSADMLLHALASIENHGLRFETARALDRLHEKNPRVAMNAFLIKSEIAREVKNYKNIQKAVEFRKTGAKKTETRHHLDVALKALLDESLERIFYYLDLLYPFEIIREIHDKVVELKEGDEARGSAMELLANMLEPDVLIMMHGVLDSSRRKVSDEELAEILKGFVESEDRWCALIGYFLVLESNFSEHSPAFEALKKKAKEPSFVGA